jgi:hypothetical protein
LLRRKCRILKYDPAGWGGHFGAHARESSNRSFDFLARKNFQITEPIGNFSEPAGGEGHRRRHFAHSDRRQSFLSTILLIITGNAAP